ncbi:MAG: hypothetical protein HFI33_10595 [Lachnospiraceae bacterium]|nr:hypothetical protein [Lachnospiraceae bacterium]
MALEKLLVAEALSLIKTFGFAGEVGNFKGEYLVCDCDFGIPELRIGVSKVD